jgi:choline trimethylamine-lyase
MQKWQNIYKDSRYLGEKADLFFHEQKRTSVLNGWCNVLEIRMHESQSIKPDLSLEKKAAMQLIAIVEKLPLTLSDHAVFVGTQNDSFSRSYALIHPSFKVEDFKGYCDPLSIFNDLQITDTLNEDKIQTIKSWYSKTDFVQSLQKAYDPVKKETEEALFFIEHVTGHLIPDFSTILEKGILNIQKEIDQQITKTSDSKKKDSLDSMKLALNAPLILAARYSQLIEIMLKNEKNPVKIEELNLIRTTLTMIPSRGAKSLYEAIQFYILLWQTMCLEQCPNPYAFSVGNVDRIFEPFRLQDNASLSQTAALLKSFLAFFNVGDRSWAISQNLLLGGKTADGADASSPTTYAFLEAFSSGNYPQPILSIRLHNNTPEKLYKNMGKFFFTPGQLTPSLFNDDSIFQILQNSGIPLEDAQNYGIAGCQEPLISGKDNGNTTNSWLNLAKVLEITLNDGCSSLTGNKLGLSWDELPDKPVESGKLLGMIKESFYEQLKDAIFRMTAAANICTEALSYLRTPFLSVSMGGLKTGIDLRNTNIQGTEYNGSGCLIHGLSVLADSFRAIEDFLTIQPVDSPDILITALKSNFKGYKKLQQFLLSSSKYGNNISDVDNEAVEIVHRVSDLISSQKNSLGNFFRADWSSPSTHLLYGYWTGATPDGRNSRKMLGYGVDPLYGEADSGLNFRMLSLRKLPFEKMRGGYASHFGINPNIFHEESSEEKGIAFKRRILNPLFFSGNNTKTVQPFYLYVNVTTKETLRKVLENPEKYAPSGVYIMRIHGTFVNFLDLSPAIQEDIILRLDNSL